MEVVVLCAISGVMALSTALTAALVFGWIAVVGIVLATLIESFTGREGE